MTSSTTPTLEDKLKFIKEYILQYGHLPPSGVRYQGVWIYEWLRRWNKPKNIDPVILSAKTKREVQWLQTLSDFKDNIKQISERKMLRRDMSFNLINWYFSSILKDSTSKIPEILEGIEYLKTKQVKKIMGKVPARFKGNDIHEHLWEKRFKKLKDFFDTHGRLPKASEDTDTYKFIDLQFYEIKIKRMKPHRLTKLYETFGEEFNNFCKERRGKQHDILWEKKALDVVAFYAKNNRLPTAKDNRLLYDWLVRSSEKYRCNRLNNKRKLFLENHLPLITKDKKKEKILAYIEEVESAINECGVVRSSLGNHVRRKMGERDSNTLSEEHSELYKKLFDLYEDYLMLKIRKDILDDNKDKVGKLTNDELSVKIRNCINNGKRVNQKHSVVIKSRIAKARSEKEVDESLQTLIDTYRDYRGFINLKEGQ